MLHSETIARIIQADRERDLERAARERRLLTPTDEPILRREPAIGPWVAPSSRRDPSTSRGACGDSAGLPA